VAGSYLARAGWIVAERQDAESSEVPGVRSYAPLFERELHVSLSRLCSHGQPEEHSVQWWCGKYGLLTGPPSRPRRSLEPEDWLAPAETDREKRNRARERRHAEILEHSMKLSGFRREARTIWQLLDLHHNLQKRDGIALLETFTTPPSVWPDSPPTVVDRHLRAYQETDYHQRVEEAGLDLEGHYIRLAHELLQRCINHNLEGLGIFPSMISLDVPPANARSAGLGFELRWNPPDLLSAIYLQLLHLFADQAATRRCDWCGQPYPLTRKDRRWCADGCRSLGRAKKSPADTI
jgi:hypothetical protein